MYTSPFQIGPLIGLAAFAKSTSSRCSKGTLLATCRRLLPWNMLTGTTKVTCWLEENVDRLGRQYVSELRRNQGQVALQQETNA